MNKENSIFINLLIILTLIALALFPVLILTSNAAKNNIDDITFNTKSSTADDISANFVTPKSGLLYSYYTFYDDDKNNNSHYKDQIVITSSDDLVQIKTVLNDFTEYDELYSTRDSAYKLGKSYKNTRESLVHNQRSLPTNNVFEPNSQALILSGPISLGNSWNVTNNISASISSVDSLVELPFGNFNAIEVSTNMPNGSYRKDYFVKYIGLVKSEIFDENNKKQTIYLNSMTDDSILTKSHLFNYDRYSNKIHSEEINLEIQTNPIFIDLLENMLKFELIAVRNPLISDETFIKSVSVDRENDTVHINFNSNLLSDSTYTETEEENIVASIANVVGNFYSVHNVQITANGKSNFGVNKNYNNPIHIDLLD